MNLYETFETDLDAETEGVWVDLDDDRTMSVKVARIGNRAYDKLQRKLLKPWENVVRQGRRIPEDEAERISNELLVQTVLKDWKGGGFVDRDGTPMLYSQANARKLLSDPKLRDFKNRITFLATTAETYRAAAIKDAEGNLSSSSDGASNGESTPSGSNE